MMGKTVCVITGTRAEYGLLYWILKGLHQSTDFNLKLVVTGMHLSPEFGLTYKEIEADGWNIDKKVELLLSSDTVIGTATSVGLGIIGFASVFEELKPEFILVLGDRFEIFAAASAAMFSRIPIVHLCGGETTEGVMDEAIRHSITKMAHIHFPSTEAYRKRIIQLGEHPDRVINVGAPGVENIHRTSLLDKEALEAQLSFSLDGFPNILVTFHPVTLESDTSAKQFQDLLDALSELESAKIIFTKANADPYGRLINKMIDEYTAIHLNSIAVTSMGRVRYLSALSIVDLVIGNSSSGLVEVPSFKIPTINIGDRQKGRIRSGTVIDCQPELSDIRKAISTALQPAFQETLKTSTNPYDGGLVSEKVINKLGQFDFTDLLKKSFYDV